MFDRWPNFKAPELLSPAGLYLWNKRGVFPLRVEAVDTLQEFRDFVGHSLLVNHSGLNFRGWRHPKENKKVWKGRNKFSFHIAGCAFDVSCRHLSMAELLAQVYKFDKWKGVGYYPSKGFIHLDLRDGPRWFADDNTRVAKT